MGVRMKCTVRVTGWSCDGLWKWRGHSNIHMRYFLHPSQSNWAGRCHIKLHQLHFYFSFSCFCVIGYSSSSYNRFAVTPHSVFTDLLGAHSLSRYLTLGPRIISPSPILLSAHMRSQHARCRIRDKGDMHCAWRRRKYRRWNNGTKNVETVWGVAAGPADRTKVWCWLNHILTAHRTESLCVCVETLEVENWYFDFLTSFYPQTFSQGKSLN